MRLEKIIAERFGRLEGCSLGELGEGLTVVVGPNEAGKTSFSALTRHVLYGYPTKRDSESGYHSSAGKRLGRLVFGDADGRWSIERAEGPHGGPVAIETLEGSARPELLETIKQGVSRDAFRVVFGFGLEELAEIEAKKGSGDDILSPLYAAQAGLAVSPSEVRQALEQAASGLWRRGGSKPALNSIKARIRDERGVLSGLESEATSFAGEQHRLTELACKLEAAKEHRDVTRTAHSELVAAAQRVEDLGRRIEEGAERIGENQSELNDTRESRDRIQIDERALANATEIEAVLGEESLFEDRLDRMRGYAQQAADSLMRAQDALSSEDMSVEQAADADVGPESLAGIERWRDRLTGFSSQVSASEQAAARARDALEAREGMGDELSAGGGAGGSVVPGIIVMTVGVVLAAIALLDGDWIQSALGALVVVVGIALILYLRKSGARSGSPGRADDYAAQAHAAQVTATRDAAEYEKAREQWRTWLAARGLDAAGDEGAAVSLVVRAIREHRSLLAERDRHMAAADKERVACEAYRDRLAALAADIVPELVGASLDDVAVHAARVGESVRSQTGAQAQRDEHSARMEQLEKDLERDKRTTQTLRTEVAGLLERFGLAVDDPLAIDAAATRAAEDATEATTQHDAIAREHAELSARLDTGGRDSAMAESRLRLTGLLEQQDELLERYAVYAVAESLMAHTQEYSEQARQPEVIRRASEVFSAITNGRYVRISPPDESGTFKVFDAHAQAKPTAELSTGTAQQLYLAVRIALVEQLDEVGHGLPVLMDDVLVNFDSERRRGTAKAVAELSRHRQVVFFTCHQDVAELFTEIDPEHTRLTLDRC